MSAVGDVHGPWRVTRVYWLDADGEDVGEPAVEWVEITSTHNPSVHSRCPADNLTLFDEEV